MHQETLVFDRADDIAELGACGALRGSVAQFAQPRGPSLTRRVEALDAWCALRAAHGVWQHARADIDGGAGEHASGLDFSARDHLSLATHLAVRQAALAALADAPAEGKHGAKGLSQEIEEVLGALLRMPHVTLFPNGWGAAFGAITALVNAEDYVVMDERARAALAQGANAATRSVLRHRHLDTGHVRELLAAIRERDSENGILVVTEGLFGVDADMPDLPLMQHLCREYGATLLVDAAQDLGVLGPNGSGALGEQAMLGKVDIVTGDFAHSFAAQGGFVASGSRAVKRQLQLFAGPYEGSGALASVAAASVLASLRIATDAAGDALRARLLRNSLALRAHLLEGGMRCLGTAPSVLPLWIGSEQVARLAARTLARAHVAVEAVEFPEALPGAARLRLQVTAAHTPQQLRDGARRIAAAVADAAAALGLETPRQPWREGWARC